MRTWERGSSTPTDDHMISLDYLGPSERGNNSTCIHVYTCSTHSCIYMYKGRLYSLKQDTLL